MNFLFYRGRAEQYRAQILELARTTWGEYHLAKTPDAILVAQKRPNDLHFCCSSEALLAVAGYAGSDSTPDSGQMLPLLASTLCSGEWPLPGTWFGSFAAVAYDRASGTVTLANDTLGSYPIYYHRGAGDSLLVGTNQILMNRLMGRPADVVGLLQAMSGPYYVNYGRRTLLTGVMGLLPGERIRFHVGIQAPEHSFDNSLFQGLREPPLDEAGEELFDLIAKHLDFLCRKGPGYLGLSGGWDSRLLLGAMRGRPITCVNIGEDDFYETQIARRCAAAAGCPFVRLSAKNLYFPTRQTLAKYVEATESAYVADWFSVLEQVPSEHFPLFLLGDMCEAIVGRNMTHFTSREARIRSYWKSVLGVRERFTPLDGHQFAAWRKEMVQRTVDAQLANLPFIEPSLLSGLAMENLRDQLEDDVRLLIGRIEDHALPFVELLDELYRWYTHGRLEMARQMLVLSGRFASISPAMSMQILRRTSTLHPRLRLRLRLMQAMRKLSPFDALARIPEAHVPWISSRAPRLVQELVWGLRFKADHFLIRRMMSRKDPGARQRVLKSFDLVEVHCNARATQVVGSWFSGRWMRPERQLKMVNNRAALAAWPTVNSDILGVANASVLLDLAIPSKNARGE